MLKVWNVSLVLATGVLAILGTFLVRSGILRLDPRLRRLDAGRAVPAADRGDDRAARSRWSSRARRRCAASTAWTRCCRARRSFLLNNLVLVALCFVIFWGTFFPLISEAITGNQASVGPPWFDRYVVPLALVLVLLSGIGPLIAWRRATAANLRRNVRACRRPRRCVALVRAARGRRDRLAPPALLMFALRRLRVRGAVGQEFWRGIRARRAMSRESVPGRARRARAPQPAPLRRLHRPRRHGACCSSASRPRRRSRTRATWSCGPGSRRAVGGYDVTLRAADGAIVAAERAARADRPRRRPARRARDGSRSRTLRTDARPTSRRTDPTLGPGVALLRGRGDERGRPAGRPATGHVDGGRAGHRAAAGADRARATSVFARRQGLSRRAARHVPRRGARRPHPLLRHDPPPATFRIIVSPLVTWIWLGALIVFAGGLIALWPAPARRRAPPRAGAAPARVARELGRACRRVARHGVRARPGRPGGRRAS